MEKHKLGWRSVVLNVLAVIFLAAFFYGIFLSVSQVASMAAQYKAMGTSVPTSYIVQQIVLAIMQYALPQLFFAVMCAVVAQVIDKMGIGADKKAEKVQSEDKAAEVSDAEEAASADALDEKSDDAEEAASTDALDEKSDDAEEKEDAE